MILDLNAIKRSGSDRQSFFFEYNPQVEVPLPDTEILRPVKVQGEVFLTGEAEAEAEGEVVFTLKGACTRCLSDAEKTFAVQFSENCGSEDGYPVVNGKIDLSKIVDDVILLNTPVAFLCKDDCKGICPSCGKNLNDGECKCNNK